MIKKNFISKIDDNRYEIMLILLNIVLFLMIIHFFPTYYDTNDDLTMSKIAAGFYLEENSQYLVFSNIIYGYFLKILYFLLEGINWYVIIPLLLALIANCFLTIISYKKTNLLLSIYVCFLLYILFGKFVFIKFQFTHMAGYLSSIGLFILLYQMKSSSKSKLLTFTGILLSLFGFLIRKDAFLSVVAIAGVYVLYSLIKNNIYRYGIKPIIKYCSSFLILGILIIGSSVMNFYFYNSDSEWSYYIEYNKYRANLLDYGMPDYEENIVQYLELGIDEIDYDMLSTWTYADQNKFTLETLKGINQMKKEESNGINTDFIKQILNAESSFYVIPISLIITVLLILLNKKNVWILFGLGMVFLEMFYLCFVNRFLFRTYFGPWVIYFMVTFFYCLYNYSFDITKKRFLLLLSTTIILTLPFINKIEEGHKQISDHIEYQNANTKWLDEVQKNSQNLYTMETLFEFGKNTEYALKMPDTGINNIYSLGGWRCPSPLNEYLLDKYEIKDIGIYLALLDDNKNVYYIDRNDNLERINKELNYIRKEYHNEANVEIIDSIDKVSIYRFYVDRECDENMEETNKMISTLQKDTILGDSIVLEGYALMQGQDTSKQNMWLKLFNENNGESSYIRMKKELNNQAATEYPTEHGISSGFSVEIDKTELKSGNYSAYIVIENKGKSFCDEEKIYEFSIK